VLPDMHLRKFTIPSNQYARGRTSQSLAIWPWPGIRNQSSFSSHGTAVLLTSTTHHNETDCPPDRTCHQRRHHHLLHSSCQQRLYAPVVSQPPYLIAACTRHSHVLPPRRRDSPESLTVAHNFHNSRLNLIISHADQL
jgi:hypothetical protein